jgi:hypothetical protein
MDFPANMPWQERLPLTRSVFTFRRAPRPSPSFAVLPLIGALLVFPGLLSLTGGMAGISVREEPQIFICNTGLAVAGGVLLVWYLFQRAEQRSAARLRLILDESGIGESGHASPQQDWRLPWSQVQAAVLTNYAGERVLRLYTIDDADRPAYLLFDYPFEQFAPEIAERLSAVGKKMIVSV